MIVCIANRDQKSPSFFRKNMNNNIDKHEVEYLCFEKVKIKIIANISKSHFEYNIISFNHEARE